MTLTIGASEPAAAVDPPRSTAADALLTDGTIVTIRQLKADDADALLAMNEDLASESLRFRFFGTSPSAADKYALHLLRSPDIPALVATHAGEIIGIASAEPVGPHTSEVAFLVADHWHGHGVGSLLLEHLAAFARDRGIDRFVADVLFDNRTMLDVFAKAGFTALRTIDSGIAHLELDTTASADYLLAADEREFASERSSLNGLLHPRSVAVYGARHDGSGIGATVLRSIVDHGFEGPTYVVHPDGGDFAGATTVRSLSDAADNVDLAVIALPAHLVLSALHDVADAKTRAVVLISSGFAEIGGAGRALQRELLDFARSHDLRVVGPNCLGVAISDGTAHLDATFGSPVVASGNLAIASQSGGVGIALMDQAQALGLGVGAFVSLGNKCDVSGNDLLAAWLDDDTVDVVALYLESFGNASKFARIARRFAERKPVLAVVGGQSTSGHRAGASHTAAAATPASGVSALFRHSGVIECADADELATTALLMTQQPLPRGPRLAILSNAGGMGCLGADTAERVGLVVPQFAASTCATLGAQVHGTIGVTNPVDAGAGITDERFATLARTCLTSDEVDALLVIIVATAMTDGSTLAGTLTDLSNLQTGKPIVLVPMGGLQHAGLDLPGITIEPTIRSAVSALASAATYTQWRSRGDDAQETADIVRATETRAAAAEFSHTGRHTTPGGWLDSSAAQRLLHAYNLSPTGEVVIGIDRALQAATSIGYPVAVKVAGGATVHKTDHGLVAVGLKDEADLVRAVRRFASILDRTDFPVLVQPMAHGVELALGMIRDPAFGPLLMVGAGGIATDLSDDRAFLIPPITAGEADRALRSLRLWPLLNGYRGGPMRDVNGVHNVLMRLARLVEEVPEIVELDINPLIVGIDHCELVDVKVRIGPSGIDAGIPRRLRAR